MSENQQETLPAKATRQNLGIGATAPDKVAYDDEAYLQKRIMPFRASLALSPDGQWVALVLKGFATGDDPDDGRDEAEPLEALSEELVGCEVVVVNTQSGEMLRPFRDFRTSFLPAWSPDGRFLALLCQDGERRYPRLTLWKKGQEESRVFETAPMSPVTGFLALRWTRDSGRVIFKVKDLPVADPVVERRTTDKSGAETRSRESLGVLDVRTGQVQVWGEMTRSCGWLLRLAPAVGACRRTNVGSPLRDS